MSTRAERASQLRVAQEAEVRLVRQRDEVKDRLSEKRAPEQLAALKEQLALLENDLLLTRAEVRDLEL